MTSKQGSSGTPEPEGRVITIGWKIVILPLLLVLVAVGGFFVGSQIVGRDQTPAVAPAAPATTAPITIQGSLGPDGSQIFELPNQGLTGRYDPDVVYDLGRRPHALLGQPAPDFTAALLGTGEQVSLSDYAGRPVLLDFWATWCPPCRVEMPFFQQAYEEYADDGLVLLGIDVGEKVPPEMAEQTIQTFVDSMGLTFPILLEGDDFQIQRAYSVVGYPTAFLINAEGIVVDFHQSMFPNYVTLESRLAPILPEGAVEASGATISAGGEG